MRKDITGNLLCYDVPKSIRNNMPQHIQDVLADRKYFCISTNAQLDITEGKAKLVNKMHQRIGLISKSSNSIQETKILHNMLVCQIATFSPICLSITLSDCTLIDKHLLNACKYLLKYMPNDAKHSIFISEKRGGISVRSFTQEYVGALMRDIEVYIAEEDSVTAHALHSSIEETKKQSKWKLNCDEKLPNYSSAYIRMNNLHISGKRTLKYLQDVENPISDIISYNRMHTMERAIKTTSSLGFMLRDLDNEFCSRFIDELLLNDKKAKAIGNSHILTCTKMGACIGEGHLHFFNTPFLDTSTYF